MVGKPASAALGLVALLSAGTAAEQLSAMSLRGAYQEAQRKPMMEPFTAKAGVKIVKQEYGGEIAKVRAMIEAGGATIDVVDVGAPTLQQGCDEGIYEILDWSKVGPREDWLPGTATECGAGTIVYATVLAYDAAKLRDGPKTIADLFDTDCWAVPKGAPNRELGEEFVRFSAQPEIMAVMSRYIPYGPVRKTATPFVDPAVGLELPTTPANRTNALTIDCGFWGDQGEEVRKRFNTWLGQQATEEGARPWRRRSATSSPAAPRSLHRHRGRRRHLRRPMRSSPSIACRRATTASG